MASVLAFATPTVFAQEADGGGSQLTDIVVTATRRETTIQETPLSISAIGGESLQKSGISNPQDLSGFAPTLHVDQGLSASQTHVSIRGIAASGFNVSIGAPIATYIDDVYQPFQWGSATQMYDMARVEVLRGPQGTLFGKNATGGALGFFSQTPKFANEGYATAELGGGDFTAYSAEGALNVKASDTLAFRVSGRYSGRDPYIDNLVSSAPGGQRELGEEDNYNLRVQARWEPTDTTKVNLKFHYMKSTSDGPIYWSDRVLPGGSPYLASFFDGVTFPTNIRDVGQNVISHEKFDGHGLTLNVEQDIGDYVLTSITNWQKGEFGYQSNDDGTAAAFSVSFQGAKIEQYSQELRIASPADKPFRWLIGGFYQHDDMTSDQGFDFLGDYAGTIQKPKTDAVALFGSATYDLTDRFSLTGGLRYSEEKKKHRAESINYKTLPAGISVTKFADAYAYLTDPATDSCYGILCYQSDSLSGKWDSVTWDATANFKPTEKSLIFARVSTGFRSGNLPFQSALLGTAEPKLSTLDPEKVTSYELGFKSQWLDNSLRLNGAVYYTDYRDLQLQVSSPFGNGTLLQNAGKARIKGAELEFEYSPSRAFLLFGSLAYIDATYKDFFDEVANVDRAGNPLPYAPKWTANLGVRYTVELKDVDVELSTNWRYQAKHYMDSTRNPLAMADSRTVGDAQISFTPKKTPDLSLSFFVRNIANEKIRSFQYVLAGTVAPAVYQPKRTYGGRISYKF
ncbi:TonB-dependent receptor [Sphingobium sp. CAP-1]|uniref:TonB-dependent receptor n=1 Tax=Sphingobium sp. CAP-1 TaxID=2676077 RepID=UPI0018AD2034|nr:TonB-dependent receptor [Sphingobium sp. CAP-1]